MKVNACLHRKTKKYRNALIYLEKALELEYNCINFPEESEGGDEDEMNVEHMLMITNPCEIHLNTCAILSQMNKHDRALHHAMKALILIQDELIERVSTMDFSLDTVAAEDLAKHPQTHERFNVLVCALHNIAVENEYL